MNDRFYTDLFPEPHFAFSENFRWWDHRRHTRYRAVVHLSVFPPLFWENPLFLGRFVFHWLSWLIIPHLKIDSNAVFWYHIRYALSQKRKNCWKKPIRSKKKITKCFIPCIAICGGGEYFVFFTGWSFLVDGWVVLLCSALHRFSFRDIRQVSKMISSLRP